MIVITSDWHVQLSSRYNVMGNGKVENVLFEDMIKTLDNFLGGLDDGTVVIMLGDVFEKKDKIQNKVKNAVIDVMEQYKNLEYYFIIGNHDRSIDGECSCRFLTNYGMLVEDMEKVVRIDNLKILLVPWIAVLHEIKNVDIVCMHKAIKEIDVRMGYVSGRDGNGISLIDLSDFEGLVFNGHYHSYMKEGNIIFVGSLYQTDWSECDVKRYIVIENGGVMVRKLPMYVKRKVVTVDAKNFKDVKKSLRNCDYNYLKVQVMGSVDMDIVNELINVKPVRYYEVEPVIVVSDKNVQNLNDKGMLKIKSVEEFVFSKAKESGYDEFIVQKILNKVLRYEDKESRD